MEFTNRDRRILSEAKSVVDIWKGMADDTRDALNGIIEGLPISDIDKSTKKKLITIAERIEEYAITIGADALEEAAWALRISLEYGENWDEVPEKE